MQNVRMFVCGPTVYDYAHLGHARTYIAFDIVARYLKFLNHSVQYLMNITDVADRIYDRAKLLNREPSDLTHEFEQAFKEDMNALGVSSIGKFERASDHIPEVISQIKGLVEKGFAYETETGVYFEVNKFPKYGSLSGLSHEELSLRRLELCSTKKNPEDFSLWRKHDKEPTWESPWGKGRPGWHVEDTAISMMELGETYDIHGGASELMFPHHEAEIAQAEALTGKSPFVRFWLHTGLLAVGGRKMSKSLGNVILIRDALKEYSAQELRWYFASYHYREPVNMTKSALQKSRREFRAFMRNIQAFRKSPIQESPKKTRLNQMTSKVNREFRRYMNDDFDTSGAIESLTNYGMQVSKLSRGSGIDARSKERAEIMIEQLLNVIGITI
jgi:cysteinyl-tRNA synthetase